MRGVRGCGVGGVATGDTTATAALSENKFSRGARLDRLYCFEVVDAQFLAEDAAPRYAVHVRVKVERLTVLAGRVTGGTTFSARLLVRINMATEPSVSVPACAHLGTESRLAHERGTD